MQFLARNELVALRNVPEGRCDRSRARSAWDSATPKEPSRRVRCDSLRCAHRFDDWSDEISSTKTKKIYVVWLLAHDTISFQTSETLLGNRAMAHSALVSRRHDPLHRAAARTSSDTNLSRRA